MSKDKQLQDFISGYLACAFWSSTHSEDGGSNTVPLEDVADIEDLDEATRKQMEVECKVFFDSQYDELVETGCDRFSQHGHDFWLTRNGHGAGFWDRGYANGHALTEVSKVYKGVDLYLGDDGKVYA